MKYKILGCVMAGIFLSAVTVSGAAQNVKVEAWLTDSIKLNIGGNDMDLPENTHVVNYDGRIYIPARFVVEEMGGTVLYDADSKRVHITKPEPEIQRVEVEKIVEREPSGPVRPYVEYDQAPTKVRINDMTINVFGLSRERPSTYVFFDFIYETMPYSGNLAFIDYKNAYIEANGIRYLALENENSHWGNSIDSSEQTIEDAYLIFEPIPNNESVSEFKIVIPVLMDEYSPGSGFVETPHVFTFFTKF